MTEAQYNKLQENRGVWDIYLQVFSINSAHPQIGAINEVYKDMMGVSMNLSCGNCIVDGLRTLYNEADKWTK